MEQFSKAYAKAVASVAGCKVDWTTIDDDSVDGTLSRRSVKTIVRSPSLDFQLKCTAQEVLKRDGVHFVLSSKNYDDLRPTNLAVPRILVVVLIPSDVSQWATHDETQLALKRCGYWMSLRDAEPIGGASTKTVVLPRAQTFDPIKVDEMFERLEQGQLP